MTDDLVERVARAIAREAYATGGMERITDPYTPDADYWNALARAAIAIALEEAARVIENECHDDMTRAEEAAAIRAMINKEEKT
jgi:hypothetical protein